MPLKRSMLRTLKRIDRWVARINRTVKEWLGLKPNWPVLILPYRGYVSGRRLVLRGRVLKDRRILKDEVNSSWRALMNNYKRFNSREVSGAAVHINADGHTLEAVTDEEGYFIIDTQLPSAISRRLCRTIRVLSNILNTFLLCIELCAATLLIIILFIITCCFSSGEYLI